MTAIKYRLKNLFESSFRWNLAGSLFFEVMRIFNNLLMIKALSGDDYGIVGSAYATVYLAARVATFGSPYVIAPLFENIEKSLRYFKRIVLHMLVAGCLINSIFAAALVIWFYYRAPSNYPSIIILGTLVVIETFRIFLRQFLHCAFKSKITIIAEQIPFVIYLLALSTAFYYDSTLITPSTIFIYYLIEASIVLMLLIMIMYRWNVELHYKTMDNTSDLCDDQQNKEKSHVFKLWFSIGILKTIRELSTNNLLTPLFVGRFGLAPAGLFYAASSIAMSLYRIMRATIGNAGLALLAHAKSSSSETKQEAFKAIVTKLLVSMIPFIIISFILNSKLFLSKIPLSQWSALVDGIDMFIIYLAIAIVEFLSIPYEQFYIVEEESLFVLFTRLGECFCFYAAFVSMQQASLTTILTCLLVFKLAFIIVLAFNAYRRWGITPLRIHQKR